MARPTIIHKYGYEEYKQNIRLREGIDEDLEPYDITLPDRPHYNQFVNYGLPKEEQFFVYEDKPDWIEKLNRFPREKAVEYAANNKEIGEWIEGQWEKRRKGIFIYIYGKPLWIPGKYWFYLNYVPLAGGFPDFRYPDLEQAYWWDLCVEKNPRVVGGIIITARRDGKSAWAGGMLLEAATRVPMYVGGAMSKSDEDAEKFFQEHIVPAWQSLPFFFSPVFDNKTAPKKEFNFSRPSKGGAKLDNSDLMIGELDSKALNSKILVGPTKETTFDGKRLGGATWMDVCLGLVFDECAKWNTINVYQAAMLHAECTRIKDQRVGKMMLLTTVEQMTPKGLISFQKLCDNSSRVPARGKVKDGQTETKLLMFFKPAWETICYDKWGFPVIDTPREDQSIYLKDRWTMMGDDHYVTMGGHLLGGKKMLQKEYDQFEKMDDRQAHISRFPPSLKEAFTSVHKISPFESAEIIKRRLQDFRHGNSFVDRFNLDIDEDSPLRIKPRKVIWTEYGRFEAPRALMEYYIEHHANSVMIDDDDFLIPLNHGKGLISIDPFKYRETEGVKKSKGAITAFFHYDPQLDEGKPMSDWLTCDWGIHYCTRPQSKNILMTDAMNLAHFLGMKIFPENNIDYTRNDFMDAGYHKFLHHRMVYSEKNGQTIAKQSSQAGIQTSSIFEMETVMAEVDAHLLIHGHRCKFKSILEDCLNLNPNDWSPFDSFVSAGRSLAYAKQVRKPRRQEEQTTQEEALGFTGFGSPMTYS